MAYKVNLNDVDPEKIGESNFAKPGWYHFRIDAANEYNEYLGIDNIIVGCVPGNESELGKKVKERLYDNKVFDKIAASVLVATGVYTKPQLSEMKAKGESPSFEFDDLIGRSFVGHYREEEYEKSDGSGKGKSTKIGFNWYHPESETAKNSGVKLNSAVLAAGNSSDPFE